MSFPAPATTSIPSSNPQSSSITSTPALTATYASPTNAHFTYSSTLPSVSSTSTTAQKTAYLSALRTAISAMQETINKELTARMEDDNARAAVAKGGKLEEKGGVKGVDEKKAEENYGEEVVEED